jgi:hypothetical protein
LAMPDEIGDMGAERVVMSPARPAAGRGHGVDQDGDQW